MKMIAILHYPAFYKKFSDPPLISINFEKVKYVHVCILPIYTISINILCVSWEELSLIEFNVTSASQRYCGNL